MEKRIFYAKKLASFYGIQLDDKDIKPVSILGGFVSKLEKAFDCMSNHIEFKKVGNEWITSNLFPGKVWKKSDSNTYDYIRRSLWMFGILDNDEYSVNDMLAYGWELKGVAEFDDFETYLLNKEDISNMNHPSLKKVIFTSMIHFLMDDITDSPQIEIHKSKMSNNIMSNYKRLFDSIYLFTFKQKTPFHKRDIVNKGVVTSSVGRKEEDIPTNYDNRFQTILNKYQDELNKIKIEVTTKDDDEFKESLRNNKLIRALRKEHRNNIKEELNTYKAAINVVNEYASTFDIRRSIGPVQEAAHIIPVSALAKEERIKEIGDSNNGLLLDPTTHRMFDKGLLLFSNDNSKLVSNREKINFNYEFLIPNKLLTASRIIFIEEWKKQNNE